MSQKKVLPCKQNASYRGFRARTVGPNYGIEKPSLIVPVKSEYPAKAILLQMYVPNTSVTLH